MLQRFNLSSHTSRIKYTSQNKRAGITQIHLKSNRIYQLQLDHDENFFCFKDSVRVIVNEDTQELLAAFNQTRHVLYLKPDSVSATPQQMSYSIKRFLFIVFITSIFCCAMVLSSQLIRYAEFFWGDLYDIMPYILSLTGIIALTWFWTTEKKDHTQRLYAVFDQLGWPKFSSQVMNCFQKTNSSFELCDHIYDVKLIQENLKNKSNLEAKEMIESLCQQKDQFDLSEVERERFKLLRYQGHFNGLNLSQIISDDEDIDPFKYMRGKLDNRPIYGYIDEFHNYNKTTLTVLCSSFRDSKGYYFWYMSDEIRFIYLDEDVVNNIENLTEKWKDKLYHWIFILGFNVCFSFIWATISEGGFMDEFGFVFLHIFAFCVVVAVLDWLYSSFYTLDHKRAKQNNINAYVTDQINVMITFPHIQKLSELKPYRMKRAERDDLSRTGFDLKPSLPIQSK